MKPTDMALDLGYTATGAVPRPARWWRTASGVRLMDVRSGGDPLGWVPEWASTEDVLIADRPGSLEVAEWLVQTILHGPAERPSEIYVEVRRVAAASPLELAPDLLR